MRRVIATALFAALTACAPTSGDSQMPSGRGPQACFMASQVNNFRQGEAQSLYLRAGRQGVFEVQSVGFCRDLDFANGMAIVPEFGGGGRICAGDRVVISLIGGGASPADGPCRARVMRRLTDAEVAALPGRSRP